jgi:adenylyltransferase/sulfurtransferase
MTSNTVALKRDPAHKPVTKLPPEGYGEVCDPEFAPDEIDSEGLRGLIRAGKRLQILDVREGWEREMALIEPSTHVPLGRLEVSTSSDIAPLDPAIQTVVYCAHGIRSLRGMRILRERHGFRSAVSLRGGMMAWSR